jgi:hypothetical protein
VSIRDDQEGEVSPADLGLPPDLQFELEAWNDEYQKIIPLDPGERANATTEIGRLDEVGRNLAAKIREACGEDAKVAYYSEGLGKLIVSRWGLSLLVRSERVGDAVETPLGAKRQRGRHVLPRGRR